MSDEKQVAIKKEAELPSTILFEDDAASGFENVKTQSLALPIFLHSQMKRTQPLSLIKCYLLSQVKRTKDLVFHHKFLIF